MVDDFAVGGSQYLTYSRVVGEGVGSKVSDALSTRIAAQGAQQQFSKAAAVKGVDHGNGRLGNLLAVFGSVITRNADDGWTNEVVVPDQAGADGHMIMGVCVQQTVEDRLRQGGHIGEEAQIAGLFGEPGHTGEQVAFVSGTNE